MKATLHRKLRKGWATGILVILICGMAGLEQMQAQDSTQKRESAVNAMTFTQLQDKFYKAEIEEEISLNIQDMTLEEALREIARETGLRLSYRGDIMSDKTVTLQEEHITVSEALADVLEGTGLDYKFSQDGYLLIAEVGSIIDEIVYQETVRGTVVDAQTGETLPGVNIVVEGTTTGTTTNMDGEFELGVPGLEETLIFSFVGYSTQTIELDGTDELSVRLYLAAIEGDELIVVGYGTQRRDDITGSVRQVSGTDIAIQPAVQTSAALMGKVPGLQVIENSGQPGENQPTLRIRGTGTLGNANPLILIDGVESSFSDVSSSDIESVTVLKDASAAAIYGSRAANGVILVTTKRGLEDGMQVNYKTYAGIRTATNHPKFTDAGTFMRLENEALSNVGSSPVWSDNYINEWEANHQTDPDRYPNTDWVSEVYSENGYQLNHYLDIVGGTERIRYRGSLGYDNEQGEIPNFGFQRYNARLNTDVAASKRINFSFDVNLQRRNREAGSASPYDIRINAYRVPPIYPAKYTHGGWGPGWNNHNPVAYANDGGVDRREMYELQGRFNSRISILDNLEINFLYSPYYTTTTRRDMTKRYAVSSIDSAEEIVAWTPSRNSLLIAESSTFRNTVNATGEIAESMGENTIRVLTGFEYIDSRSEWFNASRSDFELQDFQQLNAGSPATMSNSGSASEWALVSFFGRLNYDFQQKYLFEANLRYDGSSRFASGNRWGFFPSFSAGWMISEESFMNRIDFINSLKIRASWGQLGNQEIGNYPFASVLHLNQPFIFGGSAVTGAAQTNLANADISWETTTSQNIGIDLALLEDRAYFHFDYFQRRTQDILLQLPIPLTMGLNAPYQNAAIVDNQGWELEAGFSGFIGSELSYNLAFNLSDVKNEVVDLRGAGPFTGTQAIIEGHPINVLYGFESNGLFQADSEIENHASQFGTIAPGDIRYVDQNGDGVINDDDRVVLGDPFPSLNFGINFSINFRNFDVSAFFQGVGSRDVYLNNDAVWAFRNGGKIRQWQADDYWRPDNHDAFYPRLTHATDHNNFRASDYWVFDASYVRLRNLQIGYSFPVKIIERLQIRGARAFILGQNLFTLTRSFPNNNGLPPGVDPNVPATTSGDYYPVTRLISAGIELNF